MNDTSTDDILNTAQQKKLGNMVDKYNKSKDLELEISFHNIDFESFVRISDHLIDVVDENNISYIDTLDIIIVDFNNVSSRISIVGMDAINDFMAKYARKTKMEILAGLSNVSQSDTLTIMSKDRKNATRIDMEEYNFALKLTTETDQKKTTKFEGNENILFRYKNRYTFKIDDNLQIDVTDVKQNKVLSGIANLSSRYEIEAEFIGKKITTKMVQDTILTYLKLIQDTDIPISKSTSNQVITDYVDLLDIANRRGNLPGRSVVSLEIQHIINFIPNQYAVTDKADGSRQFMYIRADGVFLVSQTRTVKKMDIVVNDKEFFGTILDGELVRNDEIYLYLAFDIVYSKGIDYRTNTKHTLTKRLDAVNNVIDACFNSVIEFPDYATGNDEMDVEKIVKYNITHLAKYWKTMKSKIKKANNAGKIFVTRKLYFVPYGISENEVFAYADMLWKQLVYNKLAPYELDGIIYTPINTPYMINTSPATLDVEPQEYKWKPPSHNSIDFYIKFDKDANGQDIIYFDEQYTISDSNKYKMAKLYVGSFENRAEKPVVFAPKGVEQIARIPIEGDSAVDRDGNIVNDSTVVEFIYDNSNPDVDNTYKWVALRTRYDKTESVRRYGKRYGNNKNIASRIWRTINNPITDDIIASLGKDSAYEKEMSVLKEKLAGLQTKPKQSYYQVRSDHGGGMRSFNNWIKSNMIESYSINQPKVLDIGCGRGGDLFKFIMANVSEYVGVDIDYNGLYTIKDAANKRYNNYKKNVKNVPPASFIQADARIPFNVPSQKAVFPNITEFNEELIKKHLSGNEKYGLINSQFTLHYYLSDDVSWDNFCQNINDHLEPSGYILITTFDGELVNKYLEESNRLEISYTDNNGENAVFFDIRKMYSEIPEDKGTGMAIDVYNSMISEPGTYNREYLVFPEFLKKSLHDKCDLDLVESDSFYNLFNLYRPYFTQPCPSDHIKLDKRYNAVRNYYTSLSPDTNSGVEINAAIASFKLSILNRYYVFRKNRNLSTQLARPIHINYTINPGRFILPYFGVHQLSIDIYGSTQDVQQIYRAIRNRYKGIRPNVYLIKQVPYVPNPYEVFSHDIPDMMHYQLLKKGVDNYNLLIYKSPDKLYYPIYRHRIRELQLLDDTIFEPLRQRTPDKKSYLFQKDDISLDLDILVYLSNLFNGLL